MSKKKVNPKRKPATQADVERAKAQAQKEAVSLAMTIMFTAMLDGGFIPRDQMKAAFEKVEYLCESIALGYVNPSAMRKVLKDEYDIVL